MTISHDAHERSNLLKDVPQELSTELHAIEDMLTLLPEVLKKVTAHFITELDKGLSKKGGNIPMIPGWVMDFPTGKEKGDYLAIDLGGTNLRVVLVKLDGNRSFQTIQSKYALPLDMRTSTADELFGFIAKCLKESNKNSMTAVPNHYHWDSRSLTLPRNILLTLVFYKDGPKGLISTE